MGFAPGEDGKMEIQEFHRFERWLRKSCFQKPTSEAYDLAISAWEEALTTETPGVKLQCSDLLSCPFCEGKVDWCDCETPCHHIVCPECGSFDLADKSEASTIEALKVDCQSIFNKRANITTLS